MTLACNFDCLHVSELMANYETLNYTKAPIYLYSRMLMTWSVILINDT